MPRNTGYQPNSTLRAAAARTASANADRRPRSARTLNPAAVVPPGDVTISRRAAASPRSASSADEPTNSWVVKRVARARGSPASTPASINASATRKRYVEVTFLETVDGADRDQNVLRPAEIVVGRGLAAGDDRRRLADERGRVRHRPHHRDAAPGRVLQRRHLDAGGDREQAGGSSCGRRRRGLSRVRGLDGEHDGATGGDRVNDGHAGKLRLQRCAALRDDLDDRDRSRFTAPRRQQPAQQGAAHVAATDDDQVEAHRPTVGPGCRRGLPGRRGRTDIPEMRRPGHPPWVCGPGKNGNGPRFSRRSATRTRSGAGPGSAARRSRTGFR